MMSAAACPASGVPAQTSGSSLQPDLDSKARRRPAVPALVGLLAGGPRDTSRLLDPGWVQGRGADCSDSQPLLGPHAPHVRPLSSGSERSRVVSPPHTRLPKAGPPSSSLPRRGMLDHAAQKDTQQLGRAPRPAGAGGATRRGGRGPDGQHYSPIASLYLPVWPNEAREAGLPLALLLSVVVPARTRLGRGSVRILSHEVRVATSPGCP